MRKVFPVLLVVVVLVGILAACATPAPAPAPAAAEPTKASETAKPVEPTQAPEPAQASAAKEKVLEYWAWTDEPDRAFQQMVVEEFNKANPGVKIVWRPHQVNDYKTALPVAIASGKPPDIFMNWAGDDTGRLVKQGHVLDLSSYVSKFNWDKQISPAALSAFTYDGKLRGMPYTYSAKYFYYNKDIFAKNNLQVPTTFGELMKLCETFKAKGITPISLGNKERWEALHYTAIFNQRMVPESVTVQDYGLLSPDDKLFTDPGYLQSLETLANMQKAGCFPDAVNSMDASAMWAMFYTEKAAMIYEGTWAMGIFKQNGFENYGMFRMPPIEGAAGDQNSVLAGFEGLLISSKTPFPDEAAKFLDFYVTQENQRKNLEMTGGRLPVRSDAVDPATASWQVQFVVDDVAKATAAATWLDVLLDNNIAETYLNSVQELLGGTKTAQEALNAVRTMALQVKAKK